MNYLRNLSEQELRTLLDTTKADLAKSPEDLNFQSQKRAIEEEIAYVQHFGVSRKRRGYR